MKKSLVVKIIIVVILLILILLELFKDKEKIETAELKEIPIMYQVPTTDLSIKAQKKLTITNEIPSIISDKTIYLTFDDGPSHITDQILDILEKEKVAATFFVVGNNINNYKNTIKRAYQSGHTVALHSDTHNYKYIYSADENYFNDLKTIKNKVYNITGEHSRIVRLPGGSSNTVSKKYNPGIVTRITNNLQENNYYYFDWNIDSQDASGKLTKEQIYHNTTINLHHGTNIVLMHDTSTKQTTLDALPDIIKYAKENGYTFAKITSKTSPVRHQVNN